MKVVLYLRYSSDKQTELSIEGQERICREYCERENHEIINRYIDRGTTAHKNLKKRKEFLRLIDDSSKGFFEGVVVYKLDRFSRSRVDSAIYKNKLATNGVKLLSATEQLSDTPESIILESVLEGMAEYFSVELSQKVCRGMVQKALKGVFVGGVVPLGYKRVGDKIEIDPFTSKIVQEAFRRYASGERPIDIINDFNSKGYKTSTNKEFNRSSFCRMFNNERYIGKYEFMGVVNNNIFPPIIDEETFQKAKETQIKNKILPQHFNARERYILSDKIFCGKCGSKMIGSTSTSRSGNPYSYYVCVNQKAHKCTKKPTRKDKIEKMVLEETMKLLNDDYLDMVAKAVYKEIKRENETTDKREFYENKIKDIDFRLGNLIAHVSKYGSFDLMDKAIKDLQEERKTYVENLEKNKKILLNFDKETIFFFLKKFTKGDIKDKKYQKRIVDLLVHSVCVFDDEDGNIDHIDIHYNLDNEKKGIECVYENKSGTKYLSVRTTLLMTSNILRIQIKW